MTALGDDELARFAENLKRLRKAHGWTQAELAAKAGIDRTTVGSAERGRGSLSLRNTLALARALGTDVTAMTAEPPAAGETEPGSA